MFVLKFYFNNDIRRIALSEQVPFSTLIAFVKDLFASNPLPEKFVFKYVDNENDVITVTSDEELLEAFRISAKQAPSLIKFEVVPVATSQPASPFGFRPAQSNSNSTSNPSPQWPQCGGFSRGFPHPASCDSCGNRIFGLRLKCLNCPDFDLCYQCSTVDGVHDREHVRIFSFTDFLLIVGIYESAS